MNNVSLIGRLTADPKINDKITCATFTLAVDRAFKKEGEQTADFISCKMLSEKKAQFANQYLRKGKKIGVVGHIQTGSYEGKNGRVYTTDVIVDNTEFCESRNVESTNQTAPQSKPQPTPADTDFMQIDDSFGEELPWN